MNVNINVNSIVSFWSVKKEDEVYELMLELCTGRTISFIGNKEKTDELLEELFSMMDKHISVNVNDIKEEGLYID